MIERQTSILAANGSSRQLHMTRITTVARRPDHSCIPQNFGIPADHGCGVAWLQRTLLPKYSALSNVR